MNYTPGTLARLLAACEAVKNKQGTVAQCAARHGLTRNQLANYRSTRGLNVRPPSVIPALQLTETEAK